LQEPIDANEPRVALDKDGSSGSSQGRQHENEKAQDRRPGKPAHHVPYHEAHRRNPPRGGDREWICLKPVGSANS